MPPLIRGHIFFVEKGNVLFALREAGGGKPRPYIYFCAPTTPACSHPSLKKGGELFYGRSSQVGFRWRIHSCGVGASSTLKSPILVLRNSFKKPPQPTACPKS